MPEALAELVTTKGERIAFHWTTGSDLPVTVKAYDVAGNLQQTANLPRKAAREFWTDMIGEGFTLYDR